MSFGPLSDVQAQEIQARVRHDIERAQRLLEIPLGPIEARLDLSGTTAGMYCYKGHCQWLRFNPWVFATDMALHLRDTVPHEVAHYAIHQQFGRRKVKPHGPEWQSLMVAMGANPSATYTADLSAVPVRRQRRHAYHCLCRDHSVSSTRHNRIRAGRASYRCCYCGEALVASSNDSAV
ncbi:SprT-like domain-containing protein [Luminiphilus sp. nBUS_07]|uniref:SprT family zinc-dependent metalloprotease n=1 Tax=Luminiphilus sp. nBUS_07 TaxID=3395314 RepID=UPI003EBBC598